MALPQTLPAPRTPDPREGPVLRWGILGTGWIAQQFTTALQAHTSQQVVAVGSRSQESADGFAHRFGIGRAHASYDALVADREVDVVYVATPHNHHYPDALRAIHAGKHTLIEKPIALSAAQARHIAAEAQEHGVMAMEALWTHEKAPMAFNVIAFPSQEEQRNLFALRIPAVLSLLVTHSWDNSVPAADALEKRAAERIRNGIPALEAMRRLSADPNDRAALEQFERHRADFGYAFLVQRYAADGDVTKATDADIARAAKDAIPEVWIVFWAFRLMVGFGLLMLAYFVLALTFTLRNNVERQRWFLRAAVWMIPVPFLAAEAGWVVAEVGRQPWTVYEVLPTWLSASTHGVAYMAFSLAGFMLLYTVFAIIEIVLMVQVIRKGPEEHVANGGAAPAGAYSGA